MKIEGALRAFLQQRHGRKVAVEELAEIGPFIAVGDRVAYEAIRHGVRPKLAVFDLHSEREPVEDRVKRALLSLSPLTVVENPRGELREELFSVAPALAEKGGGLYVVGEEDSTALAFVLTTPYPVLYGRRGESMFLMRREEVEEKLSGLPAEVRELLKALQEKHTHV